MVYCSVAQKAVPVPMDLNVRLSNEALHFTMYAHRRILHPSANLIGIVAAD